MLQELKLPVSHFFNTFNNMKSCSKFLRSRNLDLLLHCPWFLEVDRLIEVLKILCFWVKHPVLAPDSEVLVTLGTPKMSDPMVICWTEVTVLLATILTLVLVAVLQ